VGIQGALFNSKPMFSSRNIHLAILGIILGASAGYVVAFYKANAALMPPPLSPAQAENGVPSGHPDVNSEQMLDAMRQAVEKDPKNPEILTRYGMALLEANHPDEAAQWFKKSLDLDPNNAETRSMYGAVLWRTGSKDVAKQELEAALKRDPRSLLSAHVLALIALEQRDMARADQLIKQIETIEPAYSQLPELKTRLQAERAGK